MELFKETIHIKPHIWVCAQIWWMKKWQGGQKEHVFVGSLEFYEERSCSKC
jgi:hypothetical protein